MSLMQRWTALPQKDQLRWLAVSVLTVLGLYSLLIYPSLNKDVTHAENMVNRKLDRLEKRAKLPEETKLSSNSLSAELKKLNTKEKQLSSDMASLNERFSSPDDDSAHQSLLLEISTLAQNTGLSILQQGSTATNKNVNTPVKLVDRTTGRPLLQVKAQGSYWQLVDFIQGLQQLNHVSTVLGLDLMAAVAQEQAKEVNDAAAALPPGQLKIALTLTL